MLFRTQIVHLVVLLMAVPAGWGQEPSAAFDMHEFVMQHCVACHADDAAKGDLSLQNIERLVTTEHAPQLEHLLDLLRFEQMPPGDQPQPDAAQREQAVQWTRQRVYELAASTDASLPLTRRLTNFEYQNTLRDLLGFELQLTQYLPEDPAMPYRFNNTAEFLLLGAEQLQRYEENAARAMAAAIVDPVSPEVHRARKEWKPDKPTNELAISKNRRGSPGDGMSIQQWPSHGEFRIRMQAAGVFPDGTHELPLRLVMGYSLAGDIGASPFAAVGTIYLTPESDAAVYEFRGRIENHPWEPERRYRRGGTRTGNLVVVPPRLHITPQNLFDDGTLNDGVDPAARPRAVIDWVEFEAPVADTWPPPHHRRILFDSPLRESDPPAYRRQVLQRFLTRAFRRPVREAETARYERIYAIFAAQSDSLEQALRSTLAVALASPAFLYHVQEAAPADDVTAHYEMAGRLSYFLWGSMPDERLFELAAERRLQDPVVIERQVRRMLQDPRADDFVRQFAVQWLQLERSRTIPVNTRRFPRFLYLVTRGQHAGEEVPFRPTIRDDMLAESVAFVRELIVHNESLWNIVDSDFAMLNQRLAAHYGVAGVSGHQLRRVAVSPEDHLGGLLTQGAVLTGTGTGTAPHPVYRARWLREAILGDEVREPPADVPALADSVGDVADEAASIAQLLQQHRQQESCQDCHARLDPWGLPFEQYNAIGQYQPRVPPEGTRIPQFNLQKHVDADGYQAALSELSTVDVSAFSRLPGGPSVDGLPPLKAFLLQQRRDQITENVVRRLLSYSLGRRLTFGDRPVVDSLVEQANQQQGRLQDLIVAICQSEVFVTPGQQDP